MMALVLELGERQTRDSHLFVRLWAKTTVPFLKAEKKIRNATEVCETGAPQEELLLAEMSKPSLVASTSCKRRDLKSQTRSKDEVVEEEC